MWKVLQLCFLFAVVDHLLSLVELECPETQLYVSRSSKAQNSEPISLEIQRETGEGKEFVFPLPLGESIAVVAFVSSLVLAVAAAM